MFVPSPVISLALEPKSKTASSNFSKALQRFVKEDPTFRVHLDKDSSQTIISGMGELHLDIYVERMKREYGVDCNVGQPRVSYTETVTTRAEFEYLHKKQSGGAGQYAKVCGYIEALPEDHPNPTEFKMQIIGGTIPLEFHKGCAQGFQDALEKGTLMGQPVSGVRMVVNDGAFHAVDSSEMAFRTATR